MSDPARPCLVRVEPSGHTFEAPDSLTLLEAAGFANLRLPRSCRNGTCRTCLCKLTEGRVRYTIEWPGLSREEKAEGYILPCVAIAETDLVIDAPDAVEVPARETGNTSTRRPQ
jgi:ferredoxin